jgi:hypothetical protein
MNNLKKIGKDIYIMSLISSRLAARIMDSVHLLESNEPDASAEKNKFTTHAINDLSLVGGIRLTTILRLMYERLTNEYLLNTGIGLQVPTFPNQSCMIKSQVKGQSHEVHTDGGDNSYGIGGIVHSSVVCLNSDYEGGRTQFYLTGTMEEPNIDIDIKLEAGQALIFKADLNYHGVTEVLSGTRFSLIQFWRE